MLFYTAWIEPLLKGDLLNFIMASLVVCLGIDIRILGRRGNGLDSLGVG